MMWPERLVEDRRSGGSRRRWKNTQTGRTWSSCLWTGKGAADGEAGWGGAQAGGQGKEHEVPVVAPLTPSLPHPATT